jgi:hypothetical protein
LAAGGSELFHHLIEVEGSRLLPRQRSKLSGTLDGFPCSIQALPRALEGETMIMPRDGPGWHGLPRGASKTRET